MSLKEKLISSTCCVLVAAIPNVAIAQDSQSGEPRVQDEIIVTSTKRARSVQDIPYNISAVDGEVLARTGVTDMADIARRVPGVAFLDKGPKSAGAFSNSISMRGLGIDSAGNTSDRPGLTAPTVATYLGNTPMFTGLRVKDVKRVEILRGPQGTLYGSGAMGGIVNIVQNEPNLDETQIILSTQASITDHAGDINNELGVVVNLPLSDNLAFRGNLSRLDNAGFIDSPILFAVDSSGGPILADPTNPVTSAGLVQGREDTNDEDVVSGRAALLWEATDGITATIAYHFQRDKIAGSQADTPALGEFQLANVTEQPFERDVDLLSAEVEADLGFATMTVAGSHTEVSGELIQDVSAGYSGSLADGLNFPGFFGSGLDLWTEYYGNNPRFLVSSGRVWEDEVDTLEARFSSNSDGKFDWLIGGVYTDQKSNFRQEDSNFGRGDYVAAVNAAGATLVGQDGTLASGPGFFTPATTEDLVFFFDNNTKFTEFALFGELTYRITDRWQVTGGARYFDQDFDAIQNGGIVAGGFLGNGDVSTSNSDTLFKANTSYDINDNAMLFATYAEGFRRGGANAVPESMLRPDRGEKLIYEPDTVTNYEVGVKGSLNNGFKYNLTGFYIDWENAQVNTNLTALALIGVANIPKSTSKGVEAELSGYMTENLMFNFGYSYSDTEVTESIPDAARLAEVGSSLPVPKHMASLNLTYFQQLQNDHELVWDVGMSYRGDTPSATKATVGGNAGNFTIYDSFVIGNASVSYDAGSWTLRGFVNNFTNERGTLGGNPAGRDGPLGEVLSVIRPRTIGIGASYNFSQ